MASSLGLDFGTGSVRACIVDLDRGDELGSAVQPYAHGDDGVISDARDPNLARQHPGDHLAGAVGAVRAAIAAAGPHFDAGSILGIGVDGTGSTPIPIDADGEALAIRRGDDAEAAAMAWLWKDHTAQQEAADIRAAVQRGGLPYLDPCGGVYSSEWYWSKLLRCARTSPAVAAQVHGWVELSDFVPAWLCGKRRPEALRRGICAAGHKGMFAAAHGGWPAREFLAGLHPRLGDWVATMRGEVLPAGTRLGGLGDDIAALLGLPRGIAVSVGALDAHVGALGSGIGEGDVVKVLGTSTCDMAVAKKGTVPDAVPGIAGVVPDSIVPGMVGFEAGQAAVGDLFAWCARLLGKSHDELNAAAATLRPGASGLLALDWHNGNRCVLMDPGLSGVVVGLSLHTTPAELYRAMLEATAFGAKVILQQMQRAGVPVRRLLACGGIAHKSPLLLQILADVLDRELLVAEAAQAGALGAALLGAVAAGRFADVAAAQRVMVRPPRRRYAPQPAAVAAYAELFARYQSLHDGFGRGAARDLRGDMKALLAQRDRSR